MAGILLGVAFRTKKPLALPLSAFIWKLLVEEPVTVNDIEENDCLYVQSLLGIKNIDASGVDESNFHDVSTRYSFNKTRRSNSNERCTVCLQIIPLECFESTSWCGDIVFVTSKGHSTPLTFANRHEYVERAISYRLHEIDLQVSAIREGMSHIIPVPLLRLLTAANFEQLVCGLPEISVPLLKKITR